jgi:hypothetical protein
LRRRWIENPDNRTDDDDDSDDDGTGASAVATRSSMPQEMAMFDPLFAQVKQFRLAQPVVVRVENARGDGSFITAILLHQHFVDARHASPATSAASSSPDLPSLCRRCDEKATHGATAEDRYCEAHHQQKEFAQFISTYLQLVSNKKIADDDDDDDDDDSQKKNIAQRSSSPAH